MPDIVKDAIKSAKRMKEVALESARNTLAEAMRSQLQSKLSKTINEELSLTPNNPKGYDEDGEQKRKDSDDGEAEDAKTQDHLSKEGDGDPGPYHVVEGSADEDDEMEEVKDEDDDDLDEVLEVEDDDEEVEEAMSFENSDDDDEEIEVDEVLEVDDEDEDEDMEEAHDDDDDEVIEVVDDEDEEEVTEAKKKDEDDEKVDEASLRTERILRNKLRLEANSNRKMKKSLSEHKRALVILNKRINEVNLFNARLVYATKLLRSTPLSRKQQERIIDRFDEASSINEVKKVYRALREGIAASRPIKNKKITRNVPSVRSALTEGKELSRMEELAGIL